MARGGQNCQVNRDSRLLTPAVVSNVGLGTEAPLFFVAYGVARAVGVLGAGDDAEAASEGVRVRERVGRTAALEGAWGVVALRPQTTLPLHTLVHVCSKDTF